VSFASVLVALHQGVNPSVEVLKATESAQAMAGFTPGGQILRNSHPTPGEKRELIQLATENATETLNALQARWQAEKHRQTKALSELQSALKLSNLR